MAAKKVKATETAVVATVAKTETKTTKAKKVEVTTAETPTATSKVSFSLAASALDNAESVAVLGSFNNWDLNKALYLTKQKNGSFKGTLDLTKGETYEYRFLVNNSIWVNDSNATQFVSTPFGVENCILVA
jgi:1,4-alpha-glucan branching enzyme